MQPLGHARWSLQPLDDGLVELEVADRISKVSVRQTLTNQLEALTEEILVRPAETSADFVCAMENVLDVSSIRRKPELHGTMPDMPAAVALQAETLEMAASDGRQRERKIRVWCRSATGHPRRAAT